MLIETNRLYLRELTPGDAAYFFDLNEDKEVIKYTGDVAFKNVAAAQTFLENYDQYKRYGYGRWAVIEKKDNIFLGWCGLKYLPKTGQTDLGFRFFRKYWNRGYATESAVASLWLGFEKFQLDYIIGRAMKNNLASIRVLEKTGMNYLKEVSFEETTGVLYGISKDTFNALQR